MTTYAHQAAVVDRLIAEAHIDPDLITSISMDKWSEVDVKITHTGPIPGFDYEPRSPEYPHILDVEIEREDILIRFSYIDTFRKPVK